LTTRRKKTRQSGFAIVSAIFILVALAALGTFITIVAATQHVGSALDLTAARAYFAARSGLQWGFAKVVDAAFCAANPTTTIAPAGGLTVTVTCATSAAGGAVEAGLGSIYLITATACNQPSAGACPGSAAGSNYVERRLTALVER
jgi:MSHA biogenesis protein MshP